MKFFASLVIAVATAAVAAAHPFNACKGVTDLVGVQSVTFNPEPPIIGKDLQVKVSGKPVSDVDWKNAVLHVDVKVLGVTVDSQKFAFCELVQCPLKAGEQFEVIMTQPIPSGTPDKASALLQLKLITPEGVASCLESKVEVSKGEVHAATTLAADHQFQFLFDKWRAQFPHVLGNFKVFVKNVEKIIAHNLNAEKTFEMALNEFGSMTEEEFVETRMGIRQTDVKRKEGKPVVPVVLRSDVAHADPPAEMDWSQQGVVTPVKNQGSCGSCWAFSAVGAMESAYARKYGTLLQFSEQELVSCDEGDYGCQGGLMDSAFAWVETNGGLCSEEDFPYTSGSTSARGICTKSACVTVPNSVPTGYVDIPPNEAALLAAIAEHGPASVAIEADQSAFQFYHKGVLTGACGKNLDHGVLLVGYGIDVETGIPFWKVKNSWGAGWGEQGYVRIQRGKRWPTGGECGINTKASFPVY